MANSDQPFGLPQRRVTHEEARQKIASKRDMHEALERNGWWMPKSDSVSAHIYLNSRITIPIIQSSNSIMKAVI